MSSQKPKRQRSEEGAAVGASSEIVHSDEEKVLAADFVDFLRNSPSQFHAVGQAKRLLDAAGFAEISEKNDKDFSSIKPNGKYYFSRNQSSIVAFAVGGRWAPGNGFCIQAAHTDSPVPKLKPISKINKGGFLQLGVELYGGGLWHTWFDRDLSLAGRALVRDGKGGVVSRLVHIERPILRIPSLAIHLDREVNSKGFAPNLETNTVPILASAVKEALLDQPAPAASAAGSSASPSCPEHHGLLSSLLGEHLGVQPDDIADIELCLFDTQPAALIGALQEFVVGRGLDNLCMSYLTLRALIESSSEKASTLQDDPLIRMCALFDHEEVGSSSTHGAGCNLMIRLLERLNGAATLDAAIRNSILISADMAHALHPNYQDKHEGAHRPEIHKGLVVKNNANQRYATTMVTGFIVSDLAKRHGIPLQKFVVRNDVACGSTIGPILATNTGIRTVDVGVPQLSMHSVREMCGTADLLSAKSLLLLVYHHFHALGASIQGTD